MNLYLRIKLYIMRRLFGKGPVNVVMGPMSKMLDNIGQVEIQQADLSIQLAVASASTNKESVMAGNIRANLSKLMS